LNTDIELEKHVAIPSAAYLTTKDGFADLTSRLFIWVVRGSAITGVILLIWITFTVWGQAEPALKKFGGKFILDQNWNIDEVIFGAAPYIYGTLLSATLALVVAVPIGIAVAILTSEKNLLPEELTYSLAFIIELIAAIPSVIIGLWGIYVMIPAIKPVQMWLYKSLGKIPFFSTEPGGSSLFAAALILAIMILPTIAAISRDILTTVPSELSSASLSLGANRWETILKVKLPVASAGIIGAVMLGLGRALGETMAVTMVIGNSAQINISWLDPAYTIPALLANEFAEATDPLHLGALMYLALILFALTLVVNFMALLLVRLVKR
jgi:phosphate transport system permease protein